jgi:hypothetical protein
MLTQKMHNCEIEINNKYNIIKTKTTILTPNVSDYYVVFDNGLTMDYSLLDINTNSPLSIYHVIKKTVQESTVREIFDD